MLAPSLVIGFLVTAEPSTEELHETFRALMAALGSHCDESENLGDTIEDYVLGYLEEDLGMGLYVYLDQSPAGEVLTLRAKLSFYTDDAVDMWSIETPISIVAFHRYLDELDVRVARKRLVLELPTAGEEDEDEDKEDVSIVDTLVRLFGASEDDVVAEVGEAWRPLDSDVVGVASQPDRYLLWQDRLVVGLDDEYVHLFAPTGTEDEVEVGDVIAWFGLGEHETISLRQFSQALHDAVEPR